MKIRFSVNNQWYYFYGHYTPSNGVTVGFIGNGNQSFSNGGGQVEFVSEAKFLKENQQGSFVLQFKNNDQAYQITFSNISVVFDLTEKVTLERSTFSAEVVDAGKSQIVSLQNPNINLVKHTVQYSYTGQSGTTYSSESIDVAAGVANASWAVPANGVEDLCRSTTSNRIAGTVTVSTLNATSGVTVDVPEQKTVYLSVPETTDTIPVINSVTAKVNNVPITQSTVILQEQTPVTLTASVQGKLGANIQSVRLVTQDKSLVLSQVSGSEYSVTFVPTVATNSYVCTVQVTDSRGFIATDNSVNFNVQSCVPPRFTSFTAYRCKSASDETADDEGKYIFVRAAAAASIAGSDETFTYSAEVTTSSGSIVASSTSLPNGRGILGSGNILTDQSYIVTVTATPTNTSLNSIDRSEPIGVSVYTIYRLAGGDGVAFGTIATKYGVEVNELWPFYTHGKEIMHLLVDAAHPVGSVIQTLKADFNPNELWPWTRWNLMKDCLMYGAGTNTLHSIGNIETVQQSTSTSVSYLAVNLWTRIQ